MSQADVQAAHVSLEEAEALERGGNHADALASVERSISQGGLAPDQLAEAYLLRARCKAHAGDTEGAEADLAIGEEGGADLAFFHWTRAVILEKQAKGAESKAAMALARKNDPTQRLP